MNAPTSRPISMGRTRVDHVAIVGGGFSGTLQAINLLRHDGPRVTLIERSHAVGRGVAYSTSHPGHLLNVRARNMSALPDQPDHFERWLAARGGGVGQTFASRRDYGTYLGDLLEETMAVRPGRLEVRKDEATTIGWTGDGKPGLRLASGAELETDVLVLAMGNLPPHDPAGADLRALGSDVYRADPWAAASSEGLTAHDTVLILGSGLTMIDVALTLDAEGFAGRIVALSRRGLIPRAHVGSPVAAVPLPERPAQTGAALLRWVRADAATRGWHHTIDALRPHTEGIWRGASIVERARFLRHVRVWWDVHRHRLAPQVAARIERMQAEGRLEIVAGEVLAAAADGNGAQITYRHRGSDDHQRLGVRRIVNCTGPRGDLSRSPEPLLQSLLAAGDMRPDALHLGADVNARSELIDRHGRPNPRLLALGPLTRGAFWEIASVPDIRMQAWSVARRLSDAHWVEGEGL